MPPTSGGSLSAEKPGLIIALKNDENMRRRSKLAHQCIPKSLPVYAIAATAALASEIRSGGGTSDFQLHEREPFNGIFK